MDSIVKIVLALKLKFLLIVLSIGTSYLVEYKLNNETDQVPMIETMEKDRRPIGSRQINARSVFAVSDNKNGAPDEQDHHKHAQPESFLTDRPFSYQGLEIYIEF